MGRNLSELQIGEAFGRYELLLPVARGGMSRVWAARLRGTRGFQKLVAIKTLAPEDGQSDRLEPMLLAEAQLAAQIHHPNVAQYLDLGERGGMLFVVMEWVDGESLTQIIKRAVQRGGVPLAISAQIVAQACNGLHGAHELRDARGEPLGLVHCDVSPHNLMVSASGAVKVIDFGIAKAVRGAPMENQDGLIAGKLAFMAPEQARAEHVDRRADIFSLGIVLYLLTTGRHPFGSGTAQETLERILRASPVIPPCAADPHYPPALERVVMRALANDREQRYATAAEMLYELSAAVELAHELEVGAFMQELCSETLLERRSRVQAALDAATEREDHTAPPNIRLSITDADPTPSPAESPSLQSLQHVSTTAPAAADVFAPTPAPPPRRRGGGVWLTLLACIAAALGVLAYRGKLPLSAQALRSQLIVLLGAEPASSGHPAATNLEESVRTAPAAAASPSEGSAVTEAPPADSAEAAPVSSSRPGKRKRVILRKTPGAPASVAPKSNDAKIIEHYGI
ncbi:MAG: serine/threonine-protein kinase [Polyangiaceae bacterium]